MFWNHFFLACFLVTLWASQMPIPMSSVPTQSQKTGILVHRDDVLLSQIRGDPKINLPCQPIISRKKAHKSTVLKPNMLSLRGTPHLNRFINNNLDPVQVTSFSYLGTQGVFLGQSPDSSTAQSQAFSGALPRFYLAVARVWLYRS